MTRSTLLRIATKALAAMFALTSVLLVASQALGGPVAMVMTRGSSMAPHLHQGDLVFVLRSSYQPRDVVAYRSASLNAVVLHRIVRTDGDRFIFKGDNNGWLDSEHPAASQLVGKQMLRIPGAGKILGALRTPRGIAIAVTAIALIALMATLTRSRGRKRNRRAATRGIASRLRNVPGQSMQVAFGAGAGLFVLLSAATFFLPAGSDSASTVKFKHSGSFAYSARVPAGPVYGDRTISTGDPVYLQLVPSLEVRFAYRFGTDAPHAIHKQTRLVAELTDDTGWKRTIELQPSTESRGDDALLHGRLDLAKIWRLIDEVQRLTGMRTSSYDLALVPSVDVTGIVEGKPIRATFAPRLPLQLDRLMLRTLPVATSAGTSNEPPADPLEPSQQGSVDVGKAIGRRVAIGPIRLDARAARRAGIASALACIIALAFAGYRGRARDETREDEATRILRRYRQWIVPVASPSARSGDPIVDVTSMASLLRLADRYGRMILHEEGVQRPAFFIEDEGTTYRYVTRAATAAVGAHDGADDLAEASITCAHAGAVDA
ncbi:MAG: signal peptidase I [Actinomycetota bacterium]